MPLLELKLLTGNLEQEIVGLVDSGSAVNVLPYGIGLALGGIWKPEKANLRLTGTLASFPAMPLLTVAKVGALASVELIFAWTQNDTIKPILGQINFFDEFDVCLRRSRKEIEIRTKH
ncbi:MAG: hypothetical protein JNK38_25865 [Acidobacteria bacterium]|nr:hypothetical protein [Acidobacteriota bacterium]